MATSESDDTPQFGDPTVDDTWMKEGGGSLDLDGMHWLHMAPQQSTNNMINPSQAHSNAVLPLIDENQQHAPTPFCNANIAQPNTAPTVYENYPSPVVSNAASPYYQSVEHHNAPNLHYHPLHQGHYNHRRSVSEPPGLPHQPQVTFHRDEHFLGGAPQPRPLKLKSLPKHRSSRSHPYPPACRKITQQAPAPSPATRHPGLRPSSQRVYVLPVPQHPPTSAPAMVPSHAYMPQYHAAPSQQVQQHVQQHHVSHPPAAAHVMPTGNNGLVFSATTSRVCTPTPVDPALSEPLPAHSQHRPEKKHVPAATSATLPIPMTVEELKTMIFETVKEAVVGISVENASGRADMAATHCQGGPEQLQEVAGDTAREVSAETTGSKVVQIEEVEDVDPQLGRAQLEGL